MNWSWRRRDSARWAVLLLVGGAIGFGLAWVGRATVSSDPTPVLVVTETITPSWGPAAERTRRGLLAAATSGDYEALRPYCREVVTDRRIVDEGRVVTAGGVASSLDLGLYLVEKHWGQEARARIAAQMEYRAYIPA